jgi:hypothetical protein
MAEDLQQDAAARQADPPPRPRRPGQPNDADDREQRPGAREPEPPAAGEPGARLGAGSGPRAQQGQRPVA